MYRALEGYSSAEVDLFLAMYVVGLVPGFLLVGPAGLRWGRKRVMAVGLGVAAVASVVLGLSPGTPALLCAGRFLVGVSVAVAMVIGTTWIDELTGPDAPRGTAARRVAVSLTLGFAVGAGVSGVLSQWGPAPTLTPYAVHLALCLAAVPSLLRAVETLPPSARDPRARPDLRLPRAGRRRFLLVVLPTAPWVFAASGLAYAIVPELVQGRTGDHAVAFATLLTVLTLGSGVLAQRLVPLLPRALHGREAVLGMVLMTAGAGLVVVETVAHSLVLAVVAGLTLGTAYGVTIVAGLVEVRAMALAERLPGLTGIFYALTYVGFALPVLLAALLAWVPYRASLSVVAVVCAACAGVTTLGLSRRATARGTAPRPG